MSYDVFDLVENKGDYFEVDPAVMFPATLARIKECLVSEPPVEIMTPGWTGRPDREPVADKFMRQAEGFPAGAFDEPNGDVLAFAESWFKRALALAVGHGVRIHISKNLDYKR